MKKIAIFASGAGSNAERIGEYFAGNPDIEIALVLSNRADAGVLARAKKLEIPTRVFGKGELEGGQVLQILQDHQIDFVVLAGFLLKVPQSLIAAFPEKMINLHPALLPKFGGKGMYGHHVHEAVLANHEKESGITIHFVNEKYDDGAIIFQAKTAVSPTDTPDTLAAKIHLLEHEHLPKVIDELLSEK